MFHRSKSFRRLSELSKIHDQRLLLTEAAMVMFLEKSCTFYDRKFILVNMALLRSSSAQNIQNAHHSDFGIAKQIKSAQVYDKW